MCSKNGGIRKKILPFLLYTKEIKYFILNKKIEKDTERDYFMDSNEALEYGIIDEVLKNDE